MTGCESDIELTLKEQGNQCCLLARWEAWRLTMRRRRFDEHLPVDEEAEAEDVAMEEVGSSAAEDVEVAETCVEDAERVAVVEA